MGGPRHSVERGHGSLQGDVARAAALCERRRRAGGPSGPVSPTSTITPATWRRRRPRDRPAGRPVMAGSKRSW